MEAVWTLLVVSNPLFWILAVAIFGFIVWAVEWERGLVATALFAGFCTLLYFFGNGKDAVSWTLENPYVLLWRVAAYVACGIVWATVYWIIKCFNRKHKYQEMLAQWLEWHQLDINLKKPPEENMKEWLEYLVEQSRSSRDKYRWCDYQGGGKDRVYIPHIQLRAREFKTDITRWMMWWIPSMFWWICSGFITGFWHGIQRWTAGFYNWLADWIFRGIEVNLVVPKKEEKKTRGETADSPIQELR